MIVMWLVGLSMSGLLLVIGIRRNGPSWDLAVLMVPGSSRLRLAWVILKVAMLERPIETLAVIGIPAVLLLGTCVWGIGKLQS